MSLMAGSTCTTSQLAGKYYRPLKNWHDRTRILNEGGYVLVWLPEHPKSFDGGWYYEHRTVVEAHRGYVLPSTHTIHHINEDKTDCSLSNLFVCTRAEHDRAVWLTG